MKLFKSLLLGSAAGLVAMSGASAADLGVKKPTAAEYVKVCSMYGAGFFYIPGSDVCMQLSGRVRAEYLYASGYTRGEDASSFRGHGRLNIDVRNNTSYGLLRAFVRLESYADSGRYTQAPANARASAASGFGLPNNQADILNKAFIQFYTGTAGFFTAGRSVSFFDFYANNDNYGRLIGSDRDNVNLFAYTATFGGGFSATLSVEDQYARRVSAAPLAGIAGLTYDYAAYAGSAVSYAGQRMPDIVGALRVDQAWGSAQLSGVVHQVMLANQVPAGVNALVPYADTKYGFAVQGGVKVNLPTLAAGDYFYLQAAYGNGANDFVGVTRAVNDTAQFGNTRSVAARTDGYVDSLGNTKLATSWSVVGSLVHNFTPTVQAAVYAGYGRVNYSGTGSNWTAIAPVTSALVGTSAGYVDFSAFQVGGRVNWLPARGFTIGTEVMYNRLDPKGRVADIVSLPGATVLKAKGEYDTITARIRFQRDF